MNKLNIELACEHLQQGNVIAYPTEAVWGLGCDPSNEAAVHRILELKHRPLHKGMILVAAHIDQFAALVVEVSPEHQGTLNATWPGHITWLLPDSKQQIPAWIKGSHESVALRVSAHPIVQQLCSAFGGPIVSTSANEAGEEEIRSRTMIEQKFGSKIDCIVDGELGQAAKPSQMRDLLSGKTLR